MKHMKWFLTLILFTSFSVPISSASVKKNNLLEKTKLVAAKSKTAPRTSKNKKTTAASPSQFVTPKKSSLLKKTKLVTSKSKTTPQTPKSNRTIAVSPSQFVTPKRDNKKVPNPNGKNGSSPHRNLINQLREEYRKMSHEVSTKEIRYNTPGGFKPYRYPDLVTKSPGGRKTLHQVGRNTKGGIPVIRERRAISDLSGAGHRRIKFYPYTPKSKVESPTKKAKVSKR